jgi:hypothetical protein
MLVPEAQVQQAVLCATVACITDVERAIDMQSSFRLFVSLGDTTTKSVGVHQANAVTLHIDGCATEWASAMDTIHSIRMA